MTDAITLDGVVKDFGPRARALDHLDLRVRAGEVHGFLGPNGAGKTTTIRILLGMLRADEGRLSLLGGDPWRDTVRLHRRLAYVPGEVNLWPNLSGGEVIDVLGGIDPHRREELLERFRLDPTKRIRAYSKGNRQKVALVAAFSSDVELYLLDEPTSGLDPLMEAVFQDVVQELRAQGRSILLSSHILSEVEALCDRVTIIRAGSAAESGTFDELRHLTARRWTSGRPRRSSPSGRGPACTTPGWRTTGRASASTPTSSTGCSHASSAWRCGRWSPRRRRSRSSSCGTTDRTSRPRPTSGTSRW